MLKKTIANLVAVLMVTAWATTSQAGVITDGEAIFDDANDLLSLQGTYTSANVPIEGFLFDWDGLLDDFDFSGSSLVTSNLGGTLTTPAPGFNAGSILISGFSGAPLPVPVSFDFLLSVPGAGADFLSTPIDFYLCSGCFDPFPAYDFDNGAFTTPIAGDLTAVPAPTTLALLALGLVGIGWSKRKKA